MLDINKINNPKLKRLEENNLVIEEIYLYKDKIFVRSTDGKENDSVYKATKIEKNFYKDKKRLFRETKFDKVTTYTISALKGEKTVKCSECGYEGLIKDFFDGCPYCKANFNMDYSARSKSYGKTLKEMFSTKWMTILNILLTPSIFLINIIQNPSLENIIFGLITLPFFFIIFRVILGIVFIPYIIYKLFTFRDLANDRIKFNNNEISNITLIKNINSEIFSFIYNNDKNKDIIDYDILDYISYKINKNSIMVELKLRKYYYKNNKIKRTITNEVFEFIKNINYTESNNIVKKCPSCGSNVPLSKKRCEYCNTIIPSNNLWIMK